MCNPRKVMIHVAQRIEEAWQRQLTESVSLQEQVKAGGSLAINLELSREMGAPAMDALKQVLAEGGPGFSPWEAGEDGCFRRRLEAVELVFDPANQDLSLKLELEKLIDAEGRATAEVGGVAGGEIVFAAIGHFYEDGWKGRTEEKALAEACEQARIRLARARYELKQKESAALVEHESRKLSHKARLAAEQELARCREQTRQALRQEIQARLAEARQQAMFTLNQAIGEAYRLTLCRLAQAQGGRIVSEQRSGTVIELEIEI